MDYRRGLARNQPEDRTDAMMWTGPHADHGGGGRETWRTEAVTRLLEEAAGTLTQQSALSGLVGPRPSSRRPGHRHLSRTPGPGLWQEPSERFYFSLSSLSLEQGCLILQECGRNLQTSSHPQRKGPLLIGKLAPFPAPGKAASRRHRPCRWEKEEWGGGKGGCLPDSRWLSDQGSRVAPDARSFVF